MKKLNKLFYVVFRKMILKYRLKKAIREAKSKWMLSGKRHYVIAVDDHYKVISKLHIDAYNKGRKIKVKETDLLREALYITPVTCLINI